MSLVPVDATSTVAVTDYLTKARDWLNTAVENSTPLEIADAKAEIATAAEATKQLGLSREIQLDAVEMVRRAEYALGKAIRKGQGDGTVTTQGYAHGKPVPSTGLPSPSDFASDVELYDRPTQGKVGILSIADSASPAEFDQALSEARSEGNLSRANVGRHAGATNKGTSGTSRSPELRRARADLIAALAAQGYSTRQMPTKVGVTETVVRRIARDFDIEIPADRSVGKTRRINSTQVVVNTATALEGLLAGIDLIDFDDLDLDEASQWATSLTDSTRKLARFAQQIRKATQ